MKTKAECYPCFLQQVVNSLDMMGVAPGDRNGIIKGVMNVILNCPEDWSPPEISSRVYRYLSEKTGIKDPFHAKKVESNRVAARMLPALRRVVEDSGDPLLMAVKAAIVGNIIDFGVSHQFDIEESSAIANLTLSIDHYGMFREDLLRSSTVLYLADNAGEIGFDALLIERLVCLGKDVTVAVRSAPIINDATFEDARFFGIDKIARLITSGSPAPGTPLSIVTPEFRELFGKADMVISKGQGNFETLDTVNRPVYFLLRAKCPVIAGLLGVELGSILLVKNCGNMDGH